MSGKKVDSISELTDNYLECRSFGHVQKQFVTDRITTTGRGKTKTLVEFVRIWHCYHCGTDIEQRFNVQDGMHRKGGKYRYEDGYQVTGGAKRHEAASEFVERLGFKLPN